MANRTTSSTADAMRLLVDKLTTDRMARADLAERNRDDVSAMLKQFAKDRRNAEATRTRKAKRASDARQRFVNRLKAGVKALIDNFQQLRSEMAADMRAAGDAWRNRAGGPK